MARYGFPKSPKYICKHGIQQLRIRLRIMYMNDLYHRFFFGTFHSIDDTNIV